MPVYRKPKAKLLSPRSSNWKGKSSLQSHHITNNSVKDPIILWLHLPLPLLKILAKVLLNIKNIRKYAQNNRKHHILLYNLLRSNNPRVTWMIEHNIAKYIAWVFSWKLSDKHKHKLCNNSSFLRALRKNFRCWWWIQTNQEKESSTIAVKIKEYLILISIIIISEEGKKIQLISLSCRIKNKPSKKCHLRKHATTTLSFKNSFIR